MKRSTYSCLAALLALCLGLSACGASAEIDADSTDSADDTATADTAEADGGTADDAYAYLADYSLSDAFDENGYFVGLTASDYVTLPDDYQGAMAEAAVANVQDEDVETYLNETLMPQFATTEAVTDRAAALGDSVNIDYVGSVDGVEFEGGNSGGSGYDITLGSHGLIDDFEEQIAGHMPGETFDVLVTFPEDYGEEGTDRGDLNGKEALFVTTLNHINESVIPELTDDFVRENINEELGLSTVDELRESVRQMLATQQIYNALMDNSTFEEPLPEVVTDYFRDLALYDLYQAAQQYGVDMETLLTAYGYDGVDGYLSIADPDGDARQALIMQSIAEEMDLVCDSEQLEEKFEEYFPGYEKDALVEQVGENYLKMSALTTLVLDTLLEGTSK